MNDDKNDDGIDDMLREVLGSNSPGDGFPGLLDEGFMARCIKADKQTLLNLIAAMRDDISSLGMMSGISLTAFAIISDALENADTSKFSKNIMHNLATASQMAEEVYESSKNLQTITITVACIPVDKDDRRTPEQIIDDFTEGNNDGNENS